jgi:hypothetical protein
MEKSDLKSIWNDVEIAYCDERINSERALQAILYLSVAKKLPDHFLILVEPHLMDHRPDMVIINKQQKTVDCILELKCSPHWWHSTKSVSSDFEKLLLFHDELLNKEIEFDIFGPNRVFDTEKSEWVGGRPKYLINDQTLFSFVDIVRKDSEVADKEKIKHPVTRLKNFILLIGATDPENKTSIFSVQ